MPKATRLFTNDFGFAGLTYASEDFSMLYVTKDGGETFERLELPLDTVTELPSEARTGIYDRRL
ncbi:MAG: hypothetical protein ACLVCH_10010 [Roseburia inulinivorans]